MTGAELLAYVQRRLGIEGLTDEQFETDELLDYITEGRDKVLRELAKVAPVAVRQTVTLEVDPNAENLWNVPPATLGPLMVLEVREAGTGDPMTPFETREFGGDYRLESPRVLRLIEGRSPAGGIEVDLVAAGIDLKADTAEAAIGIPVPAHRAAGKWAAVMALTANEESDARGAAAHFMREMAEVVELYAGFDAAQGLALRGQILGNYGQLYGDMLS